MHPYRVYPARRTDWPTLFLALSSLATGLLLFVLIDDDDDGVLPARCPPPKAHQRTALPPSGFSCSQDHVAPSRRSFSSQVL